MINYVISNPKKILFGVAIVLSMTMVMSQDVKAGSVTIPVTTSASDNPIDNAKVVFPNNVELNTGKSAGVVVDADDFNKVTNFHIFFLVEEGTDSFEIKLIYRGKYVNVQVYGDSYFISNPDFSWKPWAETSNSKSSSEPVFVDTDLFKSELQSGTVIASNASKSEDMKVHVSSDKSMTNQKILATSFAGQNGKNANIVTTYDIFLRHDINHLEDGAKYKLTWKKLDKSLSGNIYAYCYNQKDGAYVIPGIVVNGTAVFNDFIMR